MTTYGGNCGCGCKSKQKKVKKPLKIPRLRLIFGQAKQRIFQAN